MKLRKDFQKLCSFLQDVQKEHKSLLPSLLGGGFAQAAIPFTALYFSSEILTLVVQKRFSACYTSVFWLLILTLVFSVLARVCFQNYEVIRHMSYDSMQERLNDKAYQIEFEKLERTETMDKIRSLRVNEQTTGGISSALLYLWRVNLAVWEVLFSIGFLFRMFLLSGSQFCNTGSIVSAVLYAVLACALCALSIHLIHTSHVKLQKGLQDCAHFNAEAIYLSSLAESPETGKDVRIFGMQNLLKSKLAQVNKDFSLEHILFPLGRCNGINTLFGEIIAGGAYFLVGTQALLGNISIGDVLLYSGSIIRLTTAVNSTLQNFSLFLYVMDYLKTYHEFINSPQLSYDGTLPIEKRDDGQYEFELQDVCFSYPDSNDLILDHLSLKFTVGKSFAVVGRNGAGKSTLIKLLCRLYEPTSGKILLNGIDIRYYDYSEYVKLFSVVFQDFKIFALPLDQNVAGAEQADEQRVWNCLESVGLKGRVKSMKDGIHSLLYKDCGDGVELSGGEAQKLAIARALYKNAPFVILDEPTAALDPFSEAEIYENFGNLTKNKTSIYISHRMSSCKFCDEIIVMEHGRIAERGSHEKLMEQDGIYAQLYRTQAKYYRKGKPERCPAV